MAKGRKARRSEYEMRITQCIIDCRDDTLCLMKCLCQCREGDRLIGIIDNTNVRINSPHQDNKITAGPNPVKSPP